VDLLVGFHTLFDRERGQRGLMETTKDQFFLARIKVDVADGVNARFRRFEFFRVDVDGLAIDIETLLRNRA